MTELSPKARALIELSRPALRPTNTDRERIEAALQAKLGQPPEPIPEPAPQGASWQLITGATIGVCLLGAVAFRVLLPESRPGADLRAQPAAIVRPAPPPAEPEDLPPSAAVAGVAPPPQNMPSVKTAPSNAQDRLAVEVELLSRATRALRAGDASAALDALEQHQHRFPKGKLRLERRLAKARALCTLGRVQEGRAELADLPSQSPATDPARKACDL